MSGNAFATQEYISLGALTSDTSTSGVPLAGGEYVASVVIDSGTGTATFDASPDGGTTWIPIEDSSGVVSLTANGSFPFVIGNKMQVRGTLSGSASTPDFNFYLHPVTKN